MRSDQSQEIRNPFAAAHLRRFMSIVLAVCMILTVMPVSNAAAETVTETKSVTAADVIISDASKNYTITGGTQETPAQHSGVVNAYLGTVSITLKDTYIAFQNAVPVGCAFSIGGGKNGGAGDLTITGGRVSGQTYTDGAPDIGCGQGGSGGKVTVSAGFVHAARNLMIGGTGTVNTFTGGSIYANTVTPTPTDGTQDVYRTWIELPMEDNNTVITYKVGNGSTCSAPFI